jgi:hypothetical protein
MRIVVRSQPAPNKDAERSNSDGIVSNALETNVKAYG